MRTYTLAKKPRKLCLVWVLERKAKRQYSKKTKSQFYSGASRFNGIHITTDDIYRAPWYRSIHHANSHLNDAMKHNGFVARQHSLLV